MKLWAGRFEKETDALLDDFNSSISFDKKLYYWDIQGSIAHARMLGKIGVLEAGESEKIIRGLEEVLEDIENKKVIFSTRAEDIHMNIELLLLEKIGDLAKKLHTARSRNDQVALDLRLYLRFEILEIKKQLLDFLELLNKLAKEHSLTYLPAYTHLQRAQASNLAHYFLAYAEMFKRDIERLEDGLKRVEVSPLGSGALAGTTFPLDRKMVQEELGLKSISLNSMDAVSDRDFVIEFLGNSSLIIMHLSRFSEEIILWSSKEFDFLELDDAFSTGSSLMPQKKNPDICELIRGKTGRVYGHLMGNLTMLKGLPLAYNKDMQEDKEAVFDTVKTIKSSLLIFQEMLKTINFKKDKMKKATEEGFLNATDLADYLVKKELSFRDAHRISGELVQYCIQKSCKLEDLSLLDFKKFAEIIEEDIYESIDIVNCVERRNTVGGPSQEQIFYTIGENEKFIAKKKTRKISE